MSRTTITLPGDLIEELMSVLKAKNKTRAVIEAIKNEIRVKKKERIKEMAGKMEFIMSAEELRHRDRRLG